MTEDQREVAIWAGGAAVVVIICAVILSLNGQTDADQYDDLTINYPRYQELYQVSGGQLPVDQATALMRKQLALETGQELEARTLAVFPGKEDLVPREVIGSAVWGEGGFGNAIDYDSARTMVSTINNRLRNLASGYGIRLPARLPYEDSQSVDSAQESSTRGLQMARTTCYAMLMQIVLDANVLEVRNISLTGGKSLWRDPTGAYATVKVVVEATATYGSADYILDKIGRNRSGLSLAEWSMIQGSDKQSFVLRIAGTLTVPNVAAWAAEIRQPSKAAVDVRKVQAVPTRTGAEDGSIPARPTRQETPTRTSSPPPPRPTGGSSTNPRGNPR